VKNLYFTTYYSSSRVLAAALVAPPYVRLSFERSQGGPKKVSCYQMIKKIVLNRIKTCE